MPVPHSKPPRAFVCYRSDDELAVATTLVRELTRVLEWGTVFLDHRSLQPGEPWPARLRAEVEAADVVLVLIGRRWLTLQGPDGIRRLDDPDDWVRQEIEVALTAHRTLIPVLVDGAAPLEKRAFRTIPKIATIADLQAVSLTTKQWDTTFEALASRLVDRGFGRAATTHGVPAALSSRPFRSTIPSRGHAPFVGRDDLMEQLRATLSDGSTQQFIVLYGPPGVGKSELAREFARRHLQQYPGGAFYVSLQEKGAPIDLAAVGRTALELTLPPALGLKDQCIRTLLSLSGNPFLLIYDNASSPERVEEWLPPAGVGGHVLVTSNWDQWDARWRRVPVAPLTDAEAGRLVAALVGEAVAATDARTLIQFAGGLPVQLLPAAQALKRATERHQRPRYLAELTDETRASFGAPWKHLTEDARLLLAGALYYHPDRVSPTILQGAFGHCGVSSKRFEAALDLCLDLLLLTGDGPMRLHSLLARFVDEHAREIDPGVRQQLRTSLRDRFLTAARDVLLRPTDGAAVATLMTFSTDPARWLDSSDEVEPMANVIGRALLEIGQFAAAQPWYERAVDEKHQGDVNGLIDHESLGRSLHQVGYCLLSLGCFTEAQPWYERAVAEQQQGDVDGRMDHASIGRSHHDVGDCLTSMGHFAEAQPWYERAVSEQQQGDVQGRVDHESLGRSFHYVGWCLSSTGCFAAARAWYERAIAAKQQGSVHGRVDHSGLGMSLQEIGYCLSSTGSFADAQSWFERAVAETEQGNVHGRVDHERLGRSLYRVGLCLSFREDFAEAQPWYERSVAEQQQGDVYGRVDHESLGLNFHEVGMCLLSMGGFAEAQAWYARAVAEKRQGDVHGRVDHESLGGSLHAGGACLSSMGNVAEAQTWYARAVAEKVQGDLYGRVDHNSVENSRARLG